MLYFVICEDDSQMRIRVKSVVEEILERYSVENFKIVEFDNFEDVIVFRKDEIKEDDHCIHLFDIEINGSKNGLQLAKQIRENDYSSEIIFLTSHVELSFNVFKYKLRVLDFIAKDYDLDDKVFDALKIALQLYNEKFSDKSKYLTVKTKEKLHRIPFANIHYIDAKNSNKKICLHTDDYNLEFYDTLKKITEKLDSRFIQCHRSYIINADKIDTINSDYSNLYVLLRNGTRISVSRTHLKELKSHVRL